MWLSPFRSKLFVSDSRWPPIQYLNQYGLCLPTDIEYFGPVACRIFSDCSPVGCSKQYCSRWCLNKQAWQEVGLFPSEHGEFSELSQGSRWIFKCLKLVEADHRPRNCPALAKQRLSFRRVSFEWQDTLMGRFDSLGLCSRFATPVRTEWSWPAHWDLWLTYACFQLLALRTLSTFLGTPPIRRLLNFAACLYFGPSYNCLA